MTRSAVSYIERTPSERSKTMGCLGNILWFMLGGWLMGLSWLLFGILWCLTIVGIPIGRQCFKFASLSFFPFGKDVVWDGGSVSTLLNLIWLLVTGLPMAIEAAVLGCIFCITIIGIPFGQQCFKLARLALAPFGARIVELR